MKVRQVEEGVARLLEELAALDAETGQKAYERIERIRPYVNRLPEGVRAGVWAEFAQELAKKVEEVRKKVDEERKRAEEEARARERVIEDLYVRFPRLREVAEKVEVDVFPFPTVTIQTVLGELWVEKNGAEWEFRVWNPHQQLFVDVKRLEQALAWLVVEAAEVARAEEQAEEERAEASVRARIAALLWSMFRRFKFAVQ